MLLLVFALWVGQVLVFAGMFVCVLFSGLIVGLDSVLGLRLLLGLVDCSCGYWFAGIALLLISLIVLVVYLAWYWWVGIC